MCKKILANVIALSLLFVSNLVFAKQVTIGVEAYDHPPFFYIKDNKPEGIDIQQLTQAFTNLGYTIKWTIGNPQQLAYDLINNKIDFKYPSNPKWDSDITAGKKIIYSVALETVTDGIFMKSENKALKLNDYQTIGTLEGYTLSIILQDMIKKKQITIRRYTDIASLLDAVVKDEIQGAYLAKQVGEAYLSKHSLPLLFTTELLGYSAEDYMLATINYENILNQLNLQLTKQENFSAAKAMIQKRK